MWTRCLFRGDCHDFNYRKKGFDAAQPMKDLKCAGKLIKKWAVERNCFAQFEELVNALVSFFYYLLLGLMALISDESRRISKNNSVTSVGHVERQSNPQA